MVNIITTVGTSLFENYFRQNAKANSRSCYETIKSKACDDSKRYEDEITSLKTDITPFAESDKQASAEISSIIKIADAINDDICIHFLYSDTIPSLISAEILKDKIQQHVKKIVHTETYKIKNLQIYNYDRFDDGMSNLVSTIRGIIVEYLKSIGIEKKQVSSLGLKHISEEIIINISGGYKATIPFLTIIGQLYGVELKYIFEDSNSLISIPQLPLGFDELFIEKIYLDLKSKSFTDQIRLGELKKYGLIKSVNGKTEITSLGEVILDYIDNTSALSTSVFGHVVEFKLLEYFLENNVTVAGKRLSKISRSVYYDNKEFDLVMKNSTGDTLCFCEIKAFYQFINSEKIEEGIQKRMSAINKVFPGKTYEFQYYVYNTLKLDEKYRRKRDELCKNLKVKFGKNIKFFNVNIVPKLLSINPENPYQAYVRSKIKNEDITEIII
jgi:putative CRISPR-associated protein (TIGR02619 family)